MQGLDALGLSAEKVQKSMSVDAMGTIISVLEASKTGTRSTDSQPYPDFWQEFAMMRSFKLANNLPELRRQ